MRLAFALFLLASFAPVSLLAQLYEGPNENSQLVWDSSVGGFRLSWWGKAGRTYFLQHSEDLTHWNYVPDFIESGGDSTNEWSFESVASRCFLRLHFTDQWTDDPVNGDFDGDGVNNLNEVNGGTSPLGIADFDGDGIPDEWSQYELGRFFLWAPSLKTALARNLTSTKAILLNNATAQSGNYTISVADNLAPGYSYEDSVTGNAAFVWEDIRATGTLLSSVSDEDDGFEAVSISGFSFPFYGHSFDTVYVGSNGLLTFGSGSDEYDNSSLPNTDSDTPAYLVAPLWDDLSPQNGGAIYFEEKPDHLIVQFQDVPPYGEEGSFTFQVALFSDGRIEFRYLSLTGPTDSATVGIQDGTQNSGLQMTFDSPYLADNMTIAINPQSEFFKVAPLSGTVPANTVLVIDGIFRSFSIPFGTHQATLSVSHDAVSGANPQQLSVELEVVNLASTIALTSPLNGTVVAEGVNVALSASASDPEGVSKVEFYDGPTKIGEDPSAPYQISWVYPLPGVHSLTARAIDIYGEVTISEPVTLTVQPIPDADEDNDQMPDDWEVEHFGDTAQKGYADFDGDRIPNIFEYFHASDPADAGSVPVLSNPQPGAFHYFIVDSDLADESAFEKITVAAAVNASNDYDIIFVRPGTIGVYEENVALMHRVLLLAEPGATPVELRGVNNGDQETLLLGKPCVVDGFTITHAGNAFGPGISAYTGIVPGRESVTRILNCIIRNNVRPVPSVAGISSFQSKLEIVHCTLVGNSATGQGASAQADAIANYGGSSIELSNSIVWNRDGEAGVEIWDYLGGWGVTVVDSMVRGGQFGGADVDPRLTPRGFVTAASPAIDAATTDRLPLDIQGEARPSGAKSDLGADEWVDSDSDGLADWWEIKYFGDLTSRGDPAADEDSDNLTAAEEYFYGTSPTEPDTDADGCNDGRELEAGTDPLDADTDGDLMTDGYELDNLLNPLIKDGWLDRDQDRYPNIFEFFHGSQAGDLESIPPATQIVDSAQQFGFTHTDVQSALDAAIDYDIILVRAGVNGVYAGNIDVGHRIMLLSEAGDRLVELRGDSAEDRATISISALSLIDGFAITHSRNATGEGVYVNAGTQGVIQISNCIIRDNLKLGWTGAGIRNESSNLEIVHCTLVRNSLDNPGSIGTSDAIGNVGTGSINLINSIVWNPEGKAGIEIAGNGVTAVDCIVRGGQLGGRDVDPLLTPIGIPGSSSPAIDAAATNRLKQDIQGESRPSGAASDLGADEWVDTDSDGLADWWELKYFGDLSSRNDPTADEDSDNLSASQEYYYGTNPLLASTDGDPYPDDIEIAEGTDPLDAQSGGSGDFDGDGLSSELEVAAGSDLRNPDTNQDGLLDGVDYYTGIDPANNDVDGDGLTNAEERALGTNPFEADSDRDGVPDGTDAYPLDPTRWDLPESDPTDTEPPDIVLITPQGAVLIP